MRLLRMKRKHKIPLRSPRGLLAFLGFIPWVLFACWWTQWGEWTLIGIAGGQFVCLVLFITGDEISHEKYKKSRYV